MANTGIGGVDVRQTTSKLVFRASLKDAQGLVLSTGTTNVRLYEVQDDGTLKSYDWNDNSFKTTSLTTENSTAAHRTGNSGATSTGVWTKALSTLTGFTVGAIYIAVFDNPSACPPQQEREFQFGGWEGDPVSVHGTVSDASAAVGDWDAASGLSSTDDWYNGAMVVFISGNLLGEVRKVSDYTGSTRNFIFSGATGSLDAPWPAAPSNGSRFIIIGRG